MNWEQLLSLKRFGDTHKRIRKEQDETRLGFEVDYDRIIFSSEFRSLQDKTQVIPLSQTDFVHTRLTHSLEVSVVGRSLGRKVGQKLLEKHPHLQNVHGYQINDFGAIVAAAALAHDIGNPPFGHSGEKAIGEFFKTGKGKEFKNHLTAKEYQDLCDFEGNANGFKILTESRQGREGGLRLSYATLGTFIKYPKESLPKKPSSHIADKKYGFFQSEKEAFLDVVNELGLLRRSSTDDISYSRHPLTYLVEAADDICYTIIDFEDGINLGLIQEEYALEYLINLVKANINTNNYNALTNTEDRISYLRALAINTLINEAVEVFMHNEDDILNGDFSKGLLDVSKYKAQIDDIIKISIQNIYKSRDVIDKEIAGYEVINELLDVFTTTIYNKHINNLSNYNQLILSLFPKTLDLNHLTVYDSLLAICNFISKLSDSNAILTYRKLKGNHL
ncbi:MAG: deoxyguanosinetriphosphate triphosphohydrolase [Gelidibacter sp.]|nr:deoxyguanosinetriphosphate triphosphohydrolase [Gelidibacter sp.]